jgi:hypothetical protein
MYTVVLNNFLDLSSKFEENFFVSAYKYPCLYFRKVCQNLCSKRVHVKKKYIISNNPSKFFRVKKISAFTVHGDSRNART